MHPLSRTTRALALASLVLLGLAPLARADITPAPPLVLHLRRASIVAAETGAPEAEAQRVLGLARTEIRAALPSIERCGARVHGGFSWRDYETRRATVRLAWAAGTGTPTEARVVSSTFAHDVGTCMLTAARGLAVAPPPTGRVVIDLAFERS